jgi:uncharacterized RDD family membrane protein YckC
VTRLTAGAVDALTVAVALVLGYAAYNGLLFMISPRNFQFTKASAVPITTVAVVAMVIYLTAAWSTSGRTYGDHVMGVRVVGPLGRRVSVPRAFVRAVLCVAFPIGLFWCAVSPARRSVQDVVVRTSVIYDWMPGPTLDPSRTPAAGPVSIMDGADER